MRLALIGLLLRNASASPLQMIFLAGYGLETFVGTPPQRYLLGPDFSGDEVRLFAGADFRSPFLEPVGHSSSFRLEVGGRYVDNITVAGIEFGSVPVNIERDDLETDAAYHADADGRIGLGPHSALSRERVLAFSPCRMAVGMSHPETFEISFPDSMPPASPEYDDVMIPLDTRSSSWAFRGQLKVNGVVLAAAEIELKPTSATHIEVPKEAMAKLLIGIGDSMHLDSVTGRVSLPCDARGRIINPPNIELPLPGGKIIKLGNVQVMGPAPIPGMCATFLRLNTQSSKWIINPILLSNLAAVYFDRRETRMVVRTWKPAAARTATRVLPGLSLPTFPIYTGAPTVTTSAEGLTSITFTPSGWTRFERRGLILMSLRPHQQPERFWQYTFRRLSFNPMPQSTTVLPGVYALADGPELKILRPSMTAQLRMRSASPATGRQRFTVKVVENGVMIMIQLFPEHSQPGDASK